MSRELDAQCAHALGQLWVDACPLGDPTCAGKYMPQIGRWPCLAPFSTDHEAARLLEDEIERRGVQKAYISALCRDGGLDDPFSDYAILEFTLEAFWQVMRATPEQRARAFLEAMKQ
jgi:hypothetical protein